MIGNSNINYSIFKAVFRIVVLLFVSFLLTISTALSQTDSASTEEVPFDFPIIIRYKNNSSELSHVNRYRLSVLADYLINHPNQQIIIEGHVCCGPAPHVSKRRARGVYRQLRKLDVPKNQMSYIGKSFDEPKVLKEKNEQDKDMNRRVEIELVK
jgi:outer membrane protein OmpA-like peptidoglycan-associated protein